MRQARQATRSPLAQMTRDHTRARAPGRPPLAPVMPIRPAAGSQQARLQGKKSLVPARNTGTRATRITSAPPATAHQHPPQPPGSRQDRDRGQAARLAFAAFFGLTTMSVLAALAGDAAVYTPADLIAGGVPWLVALAALVLIFSRASNRYFRPEAAAVAHPAG